MFPTFDFSGLYNCELGAKLSVFSSSIAAKVEVEGGCWQN